MRTRLLTLVTTTALAVTALAGLPPAQASQESVPAPSPGLMPATVPAAFTPTIAGTRVESIAQVGNQLVIGGAFNSVGGSARTGLAAFNATTGALTTGFNPVVTGRVVAVIPGPTPGTVYAAGTISKIGATRVSKIALLDLTTGALVPGFKAPTINGSVQDLDLRGGRLFVGGAFTTVGGSPRGGLATLNATTGALDSLLQVNLTERHNSGSAVAAIGVAKMDVTEDGTQMVVVGNFKKADGLDRDQIVQIDLTGAQAVVRPDWQTDRYKPACFSNAFDSYMRGVDYSPDGSYFVVTATGGPNPGTLCDTASRWETAASGAGLQPTWINHAGGDTLVGVTTTDVAVFVGGHQRWLNNPQGGDYPASGAVPRPGLAALDPISGRPLTWNPGRNPRGVAVNAFLATDAGLWMGSDTDWVGNRQYKRTKLAFFPYAGGTPVRSTAIPTLPATAYVGLPASGGASNVLYRVNTGGGEILADDGGPNWLADDGGAFPYRNSGSNAAGWSPSATFDATIPAGTPSALFDTERWDPADATEMQWEFPVPAGTPLTVRLYLANRCSCTAGAGQRVFDISVDGTVVVDDLDLSGQVGDQVATMRSTDIVSDGVVDIDFTHVVENPLVNGIEILRTDITPGPLGPGPLTARSFDGTSAGPVEAVASAIDWNTVRGAFTVGDQLFFGQAGALRKASFNGQSIGTPTIVQPYHDPVWMNVDNGSNGTYDGRDPDFYSQLSAVSGMFYADGRIYFNQSGSSALYWLWFSPDSGIADGVRFTAPSSMSFSDTAGMFSTPGWLWFVSRTTGDLNRIAFSGGAVTGSPELVNGPSNGGQDWRGRALFLGNPPVNQAPTAAFASMCTALACQLDGSGSSDPEGAVSSWAWDFGDGGTSTDMVAQHTFADAGPHAVTLTVTDAAGASSSTTQTVAPSDAAVGFVASTVSSDAATAAKTVTVPAAVEVGDLLVLTYVGNSSAPADPAGWTRVHSQSSGTSLLMRTWTRQATAADLGAQVTLTQPGGAKAYVGLLAYRGYSQVASSEGTSDSSSATHVAPALSVLKDDLVVALFADRSASTTTWTASAGAVSRAQAVGTGSSRLGWLVTDSDGRQSAGTYPGSSASTNAPSFKGVGVSLVLRP